MTKEQLECLDKFLSLFEIRYPDDRELIEIVKQLRAALRGEHLK